ncbi:MAG: immune inhibitor A [Anaerolineae bacterium]|nr:immune inhibitor A [Anaerolineae bacterium]
MRFAVLYRIAGLMLTVCLCFALPVDAQTDDPYPTLTALAAAQPPAYDPVALTRALRGIDDIPPAPATAPDWRVGDQQTFWAADLGTNTERRIPATLRVIGEHILLWVEDGQPVEDSDLRGLAEDFDTRIYPEVRALWGSEATPGIDGDPRIHGLFTSGLGPGVAAYFLSRHTYPQAVYPTSNQREMFFFNLDAIGPKNLDDPSVESTLSHEFQHMIRANLQRNEDLWLNEGFSTFTQLLLFDDPLFIPRFLMQPDTQLNAWTEGSTDAHYGAADLFVAYFYERYGPEALRRLSDDPRTGLAAFDHVLRDLGEPGVDAFFADWVLANRLQDTTLLDGRYGYDLIGTMPRPPALAEVSSYPYTLTRETALYSADYLLLDGLEGSRELTITLDAPETVAVIPTEPPSGDWLWYSGRGDNSAPSLTRTLDLKGLGSATLEYRVWYDIEPHWDYGYLAVSRDDGATWALLRTPHMDTSNPLGGAYGPGYTGESGGWIDERVSLDAYAGERIQVRFWMVTDDGVNRFGLALDDLRVPELGLESDLEIDGGGWEPDGWARIDNRLPQQVWVQVVQFTPEGGISVSRWGAQGSGRWTIPVIAGTSQALLVVSPYAPFTTLPGQYTVGVERAS